MPNKKKKLTLDLVEHQIQFLPLLPAVVCDLLNLDQDSDDFYEKLTELTITDPPLAARVLTIANSASTAPSTPITNIKEGLIRVGLKTILSLITTISVARIFVPAKPEHKAIWQHSLETAVFAKFIAQRLTAFKVDPEQAYTSGLLHDIGRLTLFSISAKAIEVIDGKGWDTPIELPKVERKVLGFTHAEVGYLAAHKWQLPKVLQNLIRFHHNYNIAQKENVPKEFQDLVILTQYADLLSVFVEKNTDWPKWDKEDLKKEIKSQCFHKDWPEINFPTDEIIEALPSLTDEVNAIMKSLRIA